MEKTLQEIIGELAAGAHSADDAAWLDALVRRRNREMHDGARRVAKKRLLPAYLRLREQRPDLVAAWGAPPGSAVDAELVRLLRAKPRRTASGVATVTVLAKPWPCSGDCVFCPNDVRMPKSYLADEPACQRAERCFFDPFLQVIARLRVLADMGHVTDKVELIVLGGTWSDYPRAYQTWFISELFRALNAAGTPEASEEADARRSFYEDCGLTDDPVALAQHVAAWQARVDAGDAGYREVWEALYGQPDGPWAQAAGIQHACMEDLERLHRANETAAHRCVGLVVETRPEKATAEELAFLRRLGCTKIQLGLQTLDGRLLALCGRPVQPGAVERALARLRLFGFKSHVHVMANLPGATPQKDAAEFRSLVHDARYQPDELKLYPCCLVASARLGQLYQAGTWQPYGEDALIELLAEDVLATPAHTRISRMIRDISSTDILAGNKKTNLRQMVEARVRERMAAEGVVCREMRFREIATDQVDPSALHMQTERYATTVSQERFLQWVDADGRLAAFLRLSLPMHDAVRRLACESDAFPVTPGQAMIREVHVYGKVAALNTEGEGVGGSGGQTDGREGGEGAAQHAGLGRQLVEEACRQAADAGYDSINVISAVGTRDYYRALGFVDAGLYQRRRL